MADVHTGEVPARTGLGGRAPVIAIGLAMVALLTSAIAVVVVVTRDGPAAPVAALAPPPGPLERVVAAADVVKLKRDVVERAVDDAGAVIGVTIKDVALRDALGLEAGDVLTAISGRAIEREFDVYDAVIGASAMDTSVVYVDLLRARRPVLVRWKLDGELRTTRRGARSRSTGVLGLGTSGSTLSRDPLLATIKKLGELHYEVPRATVERLLANPDALMRSARIVPAISGGRPVGFKLYAIRPNTLLAAVGIQNGDTLRAINGRALSSPDAALEAYSLVRDASELRIEIGRRGGVEETLTITVP